MTTIKRPHWKSGEPDETVTACNFCGRLNSERTIETMVQGPDDIAICDLCVDLCNDVIRGRREAAPRGQEGRDLHRASTKPNAS